jgi:hypothetical protein
VHSGFCVLQLFQHGTSLVQLGAFDMSNLLYRERFFAVGYKSKFVLLFLSHLMRDGGKNEQIPSEFAFSPFASSSSLTLIRLGNAHPHTTLGK